MNLLCPNCQKMLTVPEQYAGQLMKCPLCGGTFTVPALPASVPAGAAPSPPAPPPPPPPAPSAPETYAVRSDGNAAAPAWSPPAAAPPSPAPPPPLVPSAPEHADIPSVLPVMEPSTAPAPSTAPPEGYRHTRTIWFSSRVLPWVAPVCVVLVFILTFFPWVGLYPGGVQLLSQSAWGAAFEGYTVDPDMEKDSPIPLDPKDKDNVLPGISVLTLFYILLFIPTFLLTIASIVIDRMQVKLPPGLQKLMPWRWGIVAAANLVVYFFLVLQLMTGFSLDAKYNEWVDKHVAKDAGKTTEAQKKAEAARGVARQHIVHTFWLHLTVIVQLVGIIGAALAYWLDRRGKDRPLPRLQLMW